MATETQVAESSPAIVGPEEMNDAQRDTWLRTGEHPTVAPPAAEKKDKKSPPSAESAPANTEKKAGAEPAREEKTQESRQERNWRQLESERNKERERAERAETRLKELEAKGTRETPAETSAAKAPEVSEVREPQPPERPKRPLLVNFKTTAEYEVAMDRYDQDMDAYRPKLQAFEAAKAQAEKQKTEIAEFNKAIEVRWKGMVAKSQEKHEDFNAVALSDALAKQITMGSPVDEWALQSDAGAEILYFLGKNPDELKRIQALSRPAQHRELAKLEDQLLTAAEEATEEAEETEESESTEEKPPRREPNKVTQAPPPPREVGGAAAASGDPIKNGVAGARRDATGTRVLSDSFREAANERDIARRKRGR